MVLHSTDTHSPYLPLDVLSCIVDEVNSGSDARALRALALTSHDLVNQCQRYLFHTIDFLRSKCGNTPKEFYQKFSRAVQEYPHLCEHVRVFRLVDIYQQGKDNDADSDWLTSDTSTAILLPLLRNLQTFSFLSLKVAINWQSLNGSTREALLTVLSRPGIHHYCLYGIHEFPVNLVPLLFTKEKVHLGNFKVENLYFVDPPPSPLAPLPPSIHFDSSLFRLQSLTLSPRQSLQVDTVYLFFKLLEFFQRPGLQSFNYTSMTSSNNTATNNWVWLILKSQARCLRHLTWRSMTWKRGTHRLALCPPSPIDLSVLQSLQTLHVNLNLKVPEDEEPVFSQLIPLLNQVVFNPKLENIILEHTFDDAQDVKGRPADDSWESLDNLLTRSEAEFPALKKITFLGVALNVENTQHWRDLARHALLSKLPLTRKRGIVIRYEFLAESVWFPWVC